MEPTFDARIRPYSGMDMLSRNEVSHLLGTSQGDQRDLLHRCALAVLTSGRYSDDPRAPHIHYPDFTLNIQQDDRGLSLDLRNAPAEAFVDGKMIRGVNELLFAVVRDIVYTNSQIEQGRFAFDDTVGITDAIFKILRNARLLQARTDPNLIVCWGGHSIAEHEYSYTKHVGYELGLRRFDICTGCGPGAMKGPMKGASIGHSKQRRSGNRYIGITEPGIISAEPPNPIVNHLVIMPDIEKRLEAFVRLSHGIIVFPGGVGTAEEILYILGILLHPDNQDAAFPLVFTGPAEAVAYFQQIDRFLRLSLGDDVAKHYEIIVDDAAAVGRYFAAGMAQVKQYRKSVEDAYFFNWSLSIAAEFQQPFSPTHANMAELDLRRDRTSHRLAADLRRAFSGIVAGNVKEEGIRLIEQHGPYQLHGEVGIMSALDDLLAAFVEQQRMKLPGTKYEPCYRLQPK